jgi:hypothetical protein
MAALYGPAVMPPSVTIIVPVTKLDSSLARKAATLATSCGWPMRPPACGR